MAKARESKYYINNRDFTNEIIKPKKLTNEKKNCKKVKEIILLLNTFVFLKFLTEKIMIKKEKQRPKINE